MTSFKPYGMTTLNPKPQTVEVQKSVLMSNSVVRMVIVIILIAIIVILAIITIVIVIIGRVNTCSNSNNSIILVCFRCRWSQGSATAPPPAWWRSRSQDAESGAANAWTKDLGFECVIWVWGAHLHILGVEFWVLHNNQPFLKSQAP